MLVTMTCNCGADLQIEVNHNDTLVMMWAQRFTDAHQACGYMAPVVTDQPESVRKLIINKEPKASPKKEEM